MHFLSRTTSNFKITFSYFLCHDYLFASLYACDLCYQEVTTYPDLTPNLIFPISCRKVNRKLTLFILILAYLTNTITLEVVFAIHQKLPFSTHSKTIFWFWQNLFRLYALEMKLTCTRSHHNIIWFANFDPRFVSSSRGEIPDERAEPKKYNIFL